MGSEICFGRQFRGNTAGKTCCSKCLEPKKNKELVVRDGVYVCGDCK